MTNITNITDIDFENKNTSVCKLCGNTINPINIKIKKLNKDAKDLYKKYPSDTGFDISSLKTYKINPSETIMISTGIAIELPPGIGIQIRSRSGLAAKKGLFIINSPGTIDTNYRNEIKILLFNSSKINQTIEKGDRIGQLVFEKILYPNIIESNELNKTDRNLNGFGSTGV